MLIFICQLYFSRFHFGCMFHCVFAFLTVFLHFSSFPFLMYGSVSVLILTVYMYNILYFSRLVLMYWFSVFACFGVSLCTVCLDDNYLGLGS